MQFRVLGPLEVRATDGRLVHLGAEKHRVLLAVLLLHANQPVSVDRLVEALWPDRPPRSAAGALRTYVSALRHTLRLAGQPGLPRLAAQARGYRLTLSSSDLDLLVFEELAAGGQQALAAGAMSVAAAQLQGALGLWRGRALEDVPLDPGVEGKLAELDERRLTVLESWVDARLALGHHAEMAAELRATATVEPLREHLWAQWMLALYRSGRQAEALGAFRQLRARLVKELAIEPSPPLQRLHQQILAADPALEPPAPAVAATRMAEPRVVRQLPPDVGGFTGRAAELARLDALLQAGSAAGPLVISAIDGAGGIGKSALAIHAAHRFADRFPDGQLYTNLLGATAGVHPLAPLVVLGRFLRAIGVADSEIPTDEEEAAARFRALAASRRLLIVLDNARDAGQVRPLLPASPTCAVVVTSRQVLATLDGATHLHLDALSGEDALALLGRLAGEQRFAAEPGAAAQVARLCGYLPLALRIAGARLAARPGWPVQALAERLADAQRRLDELQLADLGVRASIQVSYQILQDSADPDDRAAAAAFPLLGLPDGPDLGLSAVMQLVEAPEVVAEQVVERLVDAQLLESWVPGRYRMHDLLRLYARERSAERYPPPARAAALARAFDCYLTTACRAFRLLLPGDQRPRLMNRLAASQPGRRLATVGAALDWLETERANLVAAVHQAAATEGVPAHIPTELAQALFAFFEVRGYWQDWIEVNRTALAVARRAGDRAAEAYANRDLGVAHELRGQYGEALARLRDGLTLFHELGDRHGEASCLNSLGIVHHRQGEAAEARACLQQSVALRRELGDRHLQAISLSNLGQIHQGQGQYAEALACLEEALAISQQLGERLTQALSLHNLGMVYDQQGSSAQARDHYEESLAIFRELGDRPGQAETLTNLGQLHRHQGRYEQALACLGESLTILRQLGERRGEAECLQQLGSTLSDLGRHQQARLQWQRALVIFEELGVADAGAVKALLESAGEPSLQGTTAPPGPTGTPR